MSDKGHEITAHKTLVARVTVEPRDAVPPYFDKTDAVEVTDINDDSGAGGYTCSCGAFFEDAAAAHDHLATNDAIETDEYICPNRCLQTTLLQKLKHRLLGHCSQCGAV